MKIAIKNIGLITSAQMEIHSGPTPFCFSTLLYHQDTSLSVMFLSFGLVQSASIRQPAIDKNLKSKESVMCEQICLL